MTAKPSLPRSRTESDHLRQGQRRRRGQDQCEAPVILVLRIRDGDHRNEIVSAPIPKKDVRADVHVARAPSPCRLV
jgi:hypothetical protein